MIKFQKRAARVILDKDYDTPCAVLFSLLEWMKFDEWVIFKKAALAYKSLKINALIICRNMFETPQIMHTLNFRSKSQNTLQHGP